MRAGDYSRRCGTEVILPGRSRLGHLPTLIATDASITNAKLVRSQL
ncbi:MAG TPA: hypothetical protein V6D34_10875 [Candidatus Sericytochromatia bacterium]